MGAFYFADSHFIANIGPVRIVSAVAVDSPVGISYGEFHFEKDTLRFVALD